MLLRQPAARSEGSGNSLHVSLNDNFDLNDINDFNDDDDHDRDQDDDHDINKCAADDDYDHLQTDDDNSQPVDRGKLGVRTEGQPNRYRRLRPMVIHLA